MKYKIIGLITLLSLIFMVFAVWQVALIKKSSGHSSLSSAGFNSTTSSNSTNPYNNNTDDSSFSKVSQIEGNLGSISDDRNSSAGLDINYSGLIPGTDPSKVGDNPGSGSLLPSEETGSSGAGQKENSKNNSKTSNPGHSTSPYRKPNYEEVIIEPSRTSQELRETADFFLTRKEKLERSFDGASYCFKKILLDESKNIYAYSYAKNEAYATSLNGYFNYLLDENASTTYLSPCVLNLGVLFEEENRRARAEDRSYADQDILASFKQSLIALLGDHYEEEVFDFIYTNYKYLFDVRLSGESVPIVAFKMETSFFEIYFRNSFITYVEFFIK